MKTSKLSFLHGFFFAKYFTNREKLQRFQQRQLHKILTEHGTRFYPKSDKLSDFPVITPISVKKRRWILLCKPKIVGILVRY